MNDDIAAAQLARLRQQLDQIDQRIAQDVHDRFETVRQVGELKRSAGIAMMQPGRVDVVMSRASRLETDYAIPPGTLTAIFATLVEQACRLEDGIIEEDQPAQ